MLQIKETRRGIQIADVWYAQEKIKDSGIIRYREALKPLDGQFQKIRTLMSDLTVSEEEILARFTKNCRYEIRRAQREEVETFHYLGKEITGEICDEFVRYYEEFWKSKGNPMIESDKISREITRYAAQDSFAITKAIIGKTAVVYHTYIVGDTIVRLYQSASHFRTEEEITQSLVGMANRYLHKEDMIWFKGLGKKTYDWGGAGQQEEVASITRFKEAFGGEERFLYDGEEVVGWKARGYRLLTKLAGRLNM